MSRLSHLGDDGAAKMVDVGGKRESDREATAEGRISMSPEALEAVRTGDAPKGDVLGTARIAAIMAAKRTAEIIPLCHPLPLDGIAVNFAFEKDAVAVTATVRTHARTGVEMEALTAAATALLTIYDMAKAIDKGMEIGGVRLLEKKGGKSGHWTAR